MSELGRYSYCGCAYPPSSIAGPCAYCNDTKMCKIDHGEWVKWSDVEAELKALRADSSVARQSGYTRQIMLDKAKETIERLLQERRVLAEEVVRSAISFVPDAVRIAERVMEEENDG